MTKKLFLILLAIALAFGFGLIACGGGEEEEEEEEQCTIEVEATLDGSPWTGALNYTLTPGSGSPISGTTSVPKSFSVDAGNWTYAYVSGGPSEAYLVDITPSATQSVSGGGTITFTLNCETITPITIRIEPPEKDAEVRQFMPTTNLGTESVMYVAPWGENLDSRQHRAFVRFSLASLPAGATIQSATLYLYHIGYYGGGTGAYGVHSVNYDWEETVITWNNQPTWAWSPVDTISFDVAETGKWRSWNVTFDIDATAIENGWASWAIRYAPEDEPVFRTVGFASKEFADLAPYLEITYTNPFASIIYEENVLGQKAKDALEKAKKNCPDIKPELDKIAGNITGALTAIAAGNETLAMAKKQAALEQIDALLNTDPPPPWLKDCLKDLNDAKAAIEKMIEVELGTAAKAALDQAKIDCFKVAWSGVAPSQIRTELGNIITKIDDALKAIRAGNKTEAMTKKEKALAEIKVLLEQADKNGTNVPGGKGNELDNYKSDLEKAKAKIQEMITREKAAK